MSLRGTTVSVAGLVFGVLALGACGGQVPPGGPDADTTRLRVTNAGATTLVGLTVIFPDEKVDFGDVAAGSTSPYRPVAHGVYRYAAYSLEVDGVRVTQPVVDWVGEVPLEGEAFTYTLALDPDPAPFSYVLFLGVSFDE